VDVVASGMIKLRSGDWAWRLFTVRDAETREALWSSCWLHLLDREESRMHVRLGPGETDVDEGFLKAAACHPWEREIADASAVGWTFVELNRPLVPRAVGPDQQERPYRVLFFCQDGRCGVGQLPSGRALGEATDGELLEMIRRAN
jgi:hypothetical protein